VISIVTEGTIEEISFVDRPAQPEARLVAMPLSVEGLQELLGPEFVPGMPVSCDQCLLDCPGFTRLSPPSMS
jgi:hypothetical protein